MIRERISTRGVIRPLEPESELDAFQLPPELIGEISELAVRRYMDGQARFSRKFGKTAKAIEKARLRLMPVYLATFVAMCIVYGWLLDAKVNIAGPLIIQIVCEFRPF